MNLVPAYKDAQGNIVIWSDGAGGLYRIENGIPIPVDQSGRPIQQPVQQQAYQQPVQQSFPRQMQQPVQQQTYQQPVQQGVMQPGFIQQPTQQQTSNKPGYSNRFGEPEVYHVEQRVEQQPTPNIINNEKNIINIFEGLKPEVGSECIPLFDESKENIDITFTNNRTFKFIKHKKG